MKACLFGKLVEFVFSRWLFSARAIGAHPVCPRRAEVAETQLNSSHSSQQEAYLACGARREELLSSVSSSLNLGRLSPWLAPPSVSSANLS